MKTYAIFLTIAYATFAGGCNERDTPDDGEVKQAVGLCVDQSKIDRCVEGSSERSAFCYGPNEIGPQPYLSGSDRFYFDCAAPEEDNIVGPGPFYWRNYWCCGSRGCTPGEEIICQCGDGRMGTSVCTGETPNREECSCD